jgi:SAM-dependent methyltransferase
VDIFFELHTDLPREGPGDAASTRRAFEACSELPSAPAILDLGCGPGMQTLQLAGMCDGIITAVDTHEPFLKEVERRAEAAGVAARIRTVNQDMAHLEFAEGAFDLIWSEGAIYLMGFANGLRAWRPLLKEGGYLAVTEIAWLRADPPDEVRDYWRTYPGMRGVAAHLDAIAAAGYELVEHFTLPESAWWEDYFHPLEARIARLRPKFAGDAEAEAILDEQQREMQMYRQYADWFGYEFYVMRRPYAHG